ncbi:hypothetical protein MFU01_38730 [Myxococcus fulvus]|uniref:Uncharacterized protein n=1 Tax=Myxococcus fulvus TaxID=33 RepID=A0A511T3T8_MYXFU|nr:hypothetical protein MFU01_38730 [Myxococcus fulvus]
MVEPEPPTELPGCIVLSWGMLVLPEVPEPPCAEVSVWGLFLSSPAKAVPEPTSASAAKIPISFFMGESPV